MYEACVAKLVASEGAEHQDTLTARMNLALLLKSQGELDEALAMLQDVVTKRTSQLGTGHVDTLIAQLNLANLQAARGGEHSCLQRCFSLRCVSHTDGAVFCRRGAGAAAVRACAAGPREGLGSEASHYPHRAPQPSRARRRDMVRTPTLNLIRSRVFS